MPEAGERAGAVEEGPQEDGTLEAATQNWGEARREWGLNSLMNFLSLQPLAAVSWRTSVLCDVGHRDQPPGVQGRAEEREGLVEWGTNGEYGEHPTYCHLAPSGWPLCTEARTPQKGHKKACLRTKWTPLQRAPQGVDTISSCLYLVPSLPHLPA